VTEFDISGDLSSQDNSVETSKFAEFWSWEEGPNTLITHSVNVSDDSDEGGCGGGGDGAVAKRGNVRIT
jgi:hypothetical protein